MFLHLFQLHYRMLIVSHELFSQALRVGGCLSLLTYLLTYLLTPWSRVLEKLTSKLCR